MLKILITLQIFGWWAICLSSLVHNHSFVNVTSKTKVVVLTQSSTKSLNLYNRTHNASSVAVKASVSTSQSIPTKPTRTASVVCNKLQGNTAFFQNMSCYPPSAALKCFHDPIFCEQHFKSGKRELQAERPTYGEYSSLKHQRWFHVIQHGGIAFLFHPCAKKEEIEKLRKVASECLHRYILAPYNKLAQDRPLALVSWGCFYITNFVHESQIRLWIRKHAYSGPASHVHTNGKYNENLVKKSEVITDVKDAILCPSEEQKYMFSPTVLTVVTKLMRRLNPESIINNRVIKLSKLKPGITITSNVTLTKVKTGSAVWAAASLIFLCGILVGWLIYTKQWLSIKHGHKYDRVSTKDSPDSFECEPGESQFNLLKSSQKFMSAFRWKDPQRKNKDPTSERNLMLPIQEECSEDEIIPR